MLIDVCSCVCVLDAGSSVCVCVLDAGSSVCVCVWCVVCVCVLDAGSSVCVCVCAWNSLHGQDFVLYKYFNY